MAKGNTREIKVWIDGVRTLTPTTDGVTFTSADTNIATVSEVGVITAVENGDTTITVSKGGKSATVSVAIQ